MTLNPASSRCQPMPQIVTVTLNPALDVSAATPSVVPDHKLRCSNLRQEPGGGGVNVARVAQRFGLSPQAILTSGGHTGAALLAILEHEPLKTMAIPVEGDTRQSFTVTEGSTAKHYRFVLPGPTITSATLAEVRAKVESLPTVTVVVVSGSVPDGLEPGAFAALISDLAQDGRKVIVDTSGMALAEALTTEATLVKPSARELSGIVNEDLLMEGEILHHAQAVLRDSSVGALLVSIGAGGAFLVERHQPPTRFRAPTVRVQSTVGAGDSLVAGVATGIVQGQPLRDAVTLGIAAGTAAVMTPGSELCDLPRTMELLPTVTHELVEG